MKISDAGLDFIKSFEGYHRKLPNGDCIAYRCPAGVWTLGYGCTEGIKAGMIWTHDQAMDALRREIAKFESAVARLVTVEINQNQRDSLISFAYNCGEGALSKSTLLRKLNAGDYEGAANEFKNWTRGGGKVLPGLVRRRADEAALFRRMVIPAADPEMPQRVDEPTAKDAHIAAHAELDKGSSIYAINHKTIATVGSATTIGGTVAAAVKGAVDSTEQITLTATGLVNQVGATAQLITKYGLPFLGLALGVVMLCEVVQFIQRKKLTG